MKQPPDEIAVQTAHTWPVESIWERLDSSPDGLSDEEAARRRARFGPNELQKLEGVRPWIILWRQFQNVLVAILLIGTVLSAFLGHGLESATITVIVLFAVLLGFIQEYRAAQAINALRRMAAPTATVLRGGAEQETPARDLVPGDVVLLRAGNRVPADVRLFEVFNLQVQEAALTGESMPVDKQVAPLQRADLPLGDRTNMAYAGTVVTYGRGRAVVVATGMQTEFGNIAQMLHAVDTGKTPLQENLDRVGPKLVRWALVVVAVIVAIGLAREQPVLEMLIFGVALAVAVVPEALPAVVTISLAIGVRRLARRNALMRRLPAVETLGSTSVICTDKTGTLTKDEMTARKIYLAGQWLEVSGSGYEPAGQFSYHGCPVEPSPSLLRLLRTGVLASDAHVVRDPSTKRWIVKGDPTEGALVVLAAKAGINKAQLDAQYRRVAEIPFSSETKRMTTFHVNEDSWTACVKGAPEVIVPSCTRHLTPEGEGELDDRGRGEILDRVRQLASEGLRVIALAEKPKATLEDSDRGATLLGLVGMIDPPRPEARAAIETCRRAGIRIVMITGDHPLTAEATARELGLLQSGRVMSGFEVEAMEEREFAAAVEHIEVYARVSPAHKLRVVTALQALGHVVAMTGDGVNDAPALKKADIGIAMGVTGTDVAKEAAAMTLTDDNFASIVAAVEEGRGIFANIKKYLMFLLSSNIGEIGLMTGAVALGLPFPLTAVQILYINLATDGLPALALAVDPPEPDLMLQKPRDPRKGIFIRPVVALMLIGGFWSTLANLCVFAWSLHTSHTSPQTMVFVSLVLTEFFKAYNYRSDRLSVVQSPFANRWLNLAILWELVLLAVIVYVPFLQKPLGTFGLGPRDWAVVMGTACTVVPVLEIAKWMVRRGWFGASA